jgi:hypothetical protein
MFCETNTDSGPTSAKKPTLLTDETMPSTCESVWPKLLNPYRFSFERPPNHRTICQREFTHATAGHNLSWTGVVDAQDHNNIEASGARSLYIVCEPLVQVFHHIRAEEGGMQRNYTRERVEEKHRDASTRLTPMSCLICVGHQLSSRGFHSRERAQRAVIQMLCGDEMKTAQLQLKAGLPTPTTL